MLILFLQLPRGGVEWSGVEVLELFKLLEVEEVSGR